MSPADLEQRMQDLEKVLQAIRGDSELFQAVVNAPFEDKLFAASLFLGVVVLLLVNPADQTIDRIAICNTEIADRTKQGSMKRFEEIRIPRGHTENIIAKAVTTGKPQETTDWRYLFTPELSDEHARLNQADGGITFSCVYPLQSRDGGAMIFSYYHPPEHMDGIHKGFMEQYSQLVDAALGNA